MSAKPTDATEAGGAAHGDVIDTAGSPANDDVVTDPTVAVSRQRTAKDGASMDSRPVGSPGSPGRGQVVAKVDSAVGFARGLAEFMSDAGEQPKESARQTGGLTAAQGADATMGALQSPAIASAGLTVENDSTRDQAHEMPAGSLKQSPLRMDGSNKAAQQLPSEVPAGLSTATDDYVMPSTPQVRVV